MGVNNAMPIEIYELERREEKEWDAYVLKHPNSTFFHQIGWRNVVQETYKHKPIYLVAKEDGNIKGILPLFLMKSVVFGTKLVSVPFAPYGGVCADDEIAEKMLIEEAIRVADEFDVDYLELRYLNKSADNPNLTTNSKYVTFILNLNINAEIVWRTFNNKVRNAVRKAMKSGAEIVNDNDIEEFYGLYVRNMRNLGTPPHPFAFFKNLLYEFPEHTKVVRVQYDGMSVAAMFLLYFGDTIISGWAASDREYKKINPNNLLYWEVIKAGCEAGYKYFDFGRSLKNSGTFKFKKPWGGKIKQLHYQYHLFNNRKKMPDTSQLNPKRQKFAGVWKKLPLKMTTVIGPLIRRGIP